MSHILVNVAWPYANGPRHIGHVAGFGVPSDVYARYERMKGNDVLMVSGTDEHGTPILVEADKEGVSAQELANRYNRVIAKDLCDLGLSYDLFTRTTTGNHEKVVQELFKQCLENGYIYKGFLSYYGAARRSQIFYATDDGVTLYKKPKSGASKSTTLAKGEHIIVYKVVGSWGYAKTLRGKAGFVTAKNLKGL